MQNYIFKYNPNDFVDFSALDVGHRSLRVKSDDFSWSQLIYAVSLFLSILEVFARMYIAHITF